MKTMKIFGIGAVVLFVLVAVMPTVMSDAIPRFERITPHPDGSHTLEYWYPDGVKRRLKYDSEFKEIMDLWIYPYLYRI